MYSLDDTDEMGANAPKPLDTASLNKGGFQTLSHNEGAMRAGRSAGGRHVASSPATMPRRMLIGLAIAALVVIVVCVTVFLWVLSAPVPGSEDLAAEAAQAAAAELGEVAEGETYELRESGGTYSLVELRSEGDGQEVVVGNLPGTPVGLYRYEGTLLVPENLSDGTWEVSAYTIGSSWAPISNQDGTAVGGKGTISEATLDGSVLRLVVDGTTVEVPLEW